MLNSSQRIGEAGWFESLILANRFYTNSEHALQDRSAAPESAGIRAERRGSIRAADMFEFHWVVQGLRAQPRTPIDSWRVLVRTRIAPPAPIPPGVFLRLRSGAGVGDNGLR